MKKFLTKKLLVLLPALFAAYQVLSWRVTFNHLNEVYPGLDRKIARKAYLMVMKDALTNKLSCNLDDPTSEGLDEYFYHQYYRPMRSAS